MFLNNPAIRQYLNLAGTSSYLYFPAYMNKWNRIAVMLKIDHAVRIHRTDYCYVKGLWQYGKRGQML